jgi:hypothetical protein
MIVVLRVKVAVVSSKVGGNRRLEGSFVAVLCSRVHVLERK